MVINNTPIQRGVTYVAWADAVRVGEVVSRLDMAERMGTNYSTARYHLERAVAAGLLNKQHGYASEKQPGWIYGTPETMPRMEGV